MITNAKGKVIDVFNLVEDDISIDDIILALPNICRYGGRIEGYFSVAQHAVELARWLRKNGKQELVPHALLHDACEAYIGDVIYPIKIRIPKFLELEIEITNVIYSKYGVDPKLQDIFDYYDKGISINEMKAIGIYEREVKFASHIKELDGLNIKLMNADTARVEYINELEEYFGNEILRD